MRSDIKNDSFSQKKFRGARMKSSLKKSEFLVFIALLTIAIITVWSFSATKNKAWLKSITTPTRELATRAAGQVNVTDFAIVEGSYAVRPVSWSVVEEHMLIESLTDKETVGPQEKIRVTRICNANAKRLESLLQAGKLSGTFVPETHQVASTNAMSFQTPHSKPEWKEHAGTIRFKNVYLKKFVVDGLIGSVLAALAGVFIFSITWLIRWTRTAEQQTKFWKQRIDDLRPGFEQCQNSIHEFELHSPTDSDKTFLASLPTQDLAPRNPSQPRWLSKRLFIKLGSYIVFVVAYYGFDFFIRTSNWIGSHSDWAHPTMHYFSLFLGIPLFLHLTDWISPAPRPQMKLHTESPNFGNPFGDHQMKIVKEAGFQFVGSYSSNDSISTAAYRSPGKNLLVSITQDKFSIKSILNNQLLVETQSVGNAGELPGETENYISIAAPPDDLPAAIDLHLALLQNMLHKAPSLSLVNWEEDSLPQLLSWSKGVQKRKSPFQRFLAR